MINKKSQEDYNRFGNINESYNRRSKSSSKTKNESRVSRDLKIGNIEKFEFISNEQILVPKCLVLLSRFPFLETMKKMLNGIVKLTRTKLCIPIESYILHLFLLVPLPPRGCIEVVYQLLTSIILIKIPPVNQIPLFDGNMTILFQSLSVSVLLEVFTQLLLENNVVFLSKSTEKLSACSYTMLSLLYPFKWTFVYVPVLPIQLIDYLYSPLKYVYGIHSKFKDDVIVRCNSDVCIVNLDEGIIEPHDEMINIHSNKSELSSIHMPDHYTKKLAKKITELLTIKDGPKLNRIDSEKTGQIRNMFFQFFVSVFQNYKQYLNYERYDATDITTYFDQEGFLSKVKTSKDFFRYFFKTQMFANFCDKLIRTTNMDQHSENLLFNEHITAKKNRSGIVIHKKPTLFISDISQNIKSKYFVPPAESCFEMQSSFFYYTFPVLNYDIMLKFGMPIKTHPKLTETTLGILDSYRLSRQKTLKVTKSDSLYFIWLELWASCLWAQDEFEHTERISEVISVLDKMNRSPEKPSLSIYTFLIEACFEVNPSIALSLFSYMNSVKVLVDATTVIILQRVISKLFSNSKAVSIKSTRQSLEITPEPASVNSSEIYRKRVFNKREKKMIASHAANVVLLQKCFVCNKETIIEDNLIKNFCCKQAVSNIIKAKIGIDIGKDFFTIEEVKALTIQELDAILAELLARSNNKFCLDIEELRENSILFWNLVWNFNKANLPFKFFVPYDRNIEGNSFRITLSNDENQILDITPDSRNNKSSQTDLHESLLVSILV